MTIIHKQPHATCRKCSHDVLSNIYLSALFNDAQLLRLYGVIEDECKSTENYRNNTDRRETNIQRKPLCQCHFSNTNSTCMDLLFPHHSSSNQN